MKICRFNHNNQAYWGLVQGNSIRPFADSEHLPNVESGDFLTEAFEVENVRLSAPVAPTKIVCVGRNYAEHAAELGNEVPQEPLLFLKAPSSIITNEQPIKIPEQSVQVEHEGELAVIIGKTCKDIAENENPLDYVFGYTCLNDVTARDLQRKDVQFTRAKSFDTFCPIGAFIETDIDVSDVRVVTRVNGEIKQDGRTAQMVFPVPFLIRYISKQMTLNIGDIIATGTPSGVSKLNRNDVCEVEIEGIGILKNPVT